MNLFINYSLIKFRPIHKDAIIVYNQDQKHHYLIIPEQPLRFINRIELVINEG